VDGGDAVTENKKRDELLNSMDPFTYAEFRTRITSDYAAGRVSAAEGGWIVSDTELAAFGPSSDREPISNREDRKS
jgi:hypothetical protein